VKKLVLACVGVVMAVSAQPALAWKNTKFSIGMNYQSQSGNNDFLWGLWHNGQVPPPLPPPGYPPPAYAPVGYPPPVPGYPPPVPGYPTVPVYVPPPVPMFSPTPIVPTTPWAPPAPGPAPFYEGMNNGSTMEPPVAAANTPLYRHATYARPGR
jgi:hypothetical protein